MADRQESRWRAQPYDYGCAHRLASALGLSHTTASVLVRRGFADAVSARRFLAADETHDPGLFGGMAAFSMMFVPIISSALFLLLYSYVLYRREIKG